MKKTIFHDLYRSMRKDWDGWIVGLSILALTCYGIYWLSMNFNLNPLNWLATLGDYAYQHGGTASFIAVVLGITGLILVPITVSAWKETKVIKTGPSPWQKQPVTAFEGKDAKETLKEVHTLRTEIENLKHQLNLIERKVTETRYILKTTE